jgi:hypothetical protein
MNTLLERLRDLQAILSEAFEKRSQDPDPESDPLHKVLYEFQSWLLSEEGYDVLVNLHQETITPSVSYLRGLISTLADNNVELVVMDPKVFTFIQECNKDLTPNTLPTTCKREDLKKLQIEKLLGLRFKHNEESKLLDSFFIRKLQQAIEGKTLFEIPLKISSLYSEIGKIQRHRKSMNVASLKESACALVKEGIYGIYVVYDGSDDSGNIQNISFIREVLDENGDTLTGPLYEEIKSDRQLPVKYLNVSLNWRNNSCHFTKSVSLKEYASEVAFRHAESGWEINEGSRGEVTINLAHKQVHVSHNWRELDVDGLNDHVDEVLTVDPTLVRDEIYWDAEEHYTSFGEESIDNTYDL